MYWLREIFQKMWPARVARMWVRRFRGSSFATLWAICSKNITSAAFLLQTVWRPTSPSCLDPALPTQTTLQRTALNGSSSKLISTTCPRLTRKLPRTRNPSLEESSTRHGCRSRLRTKLARRLPGLRFKYRRSGTGIRSSSPKDFRARQPDKLTPEVCAARHKEVIRKEIHFA